MKTLLKLVSFSSLLFMVLCAVSVFEGSLTRDAFTIFSLGGTIVWFVTVPFWMKRGFHKSEKE